MTNDNRQKNSVHVTICPTIKRMEKARNKAANIIENEDLGSREKVSEIKKLYKKAAAGPGGKKPEIKYMVAKKATATARAKRPAGHKGPTSKLTLA